MRYIFIVIMPLLMAFTPAQKVKKESFDVSGVCGSCEKRIEKAALIKGVYEAQWDKHTQKLTVTYKTTKTSSENILRAVAKVGHDNEKFKASDESYAALPACCKYRDKSIEVH